MGNRAVFLDRDGVINRAVVKNGKPYAPRTFSEFEIFPDAITAAQDLSNAGFLLFVVTNQPDIGNGLVSADVVEQMHHTLQLALPITEIYMCPHAQDAGCACRKPKPGMLLTARDEFSLNMAESFMTGDRYSDICAGIAAGCTPVFIDNDYVETPKFDVSIRARSLYEATQYILENTE